MPTSPGSAPRSARFAGASGWRGWRCSARRREGRISIRSAATSIFWSLSSPMSNSPPLERFFGLAEALEALFGRPVDLVEDGAVRNPYLRAGIDRSREPVYGS
jgi:hypothetical protein